MQKKAACWRNSCILLGTEHSKMSAENRSLKKHWENIALLVKTLLILCVNVFVKCCWHRCSLTLNVSWVGNMGVVYNILVSPCDATV